MTSPLPVPDRLKRVRPAQEVGEPLLAVNGVSTWFSTPKGIVHAVDDVRFTLEAGETLGVVGESGSGKSVLARTIMRLTPRHALTQGEILFHGRDLLKLNAKDGRSIWGAQISMILQDPATALNPVLRVGRQITESLEAHLCLSPRDAATRATELLTQVGIPEAARHMRSFPHELSGGMRQRVCIAIAIACRPELLFADEPTTALDVTIQRQILDLLSQLQQEHSMAMVLITHDFGVVAKRTHRVIVMYGGKVVEVGTTETLFRRARHPYTVALLASIPRLEQPTHSRLAVIPGHPVDLINPGPGCRFAGRCRFAQDRCLEEEPLLRPAVDEGHAYACFYPVGSSEGDKALAANASAGRTVAGLDLGAEVCA